MLVNFEEDLNKGKRGERIVMEVFSSLAPGYEFEDVSDNPLYYDKGDIKVIAEDGTEIFIEVKNDERIGQTRNLLCEEEVTYYSGYCQKGFMHNDHEIFCVVSEPEKKIYVIDFSILKGIYRKGQWKVLKYSAQESECYLLPLGILKRHGGLIAAIDF